MLFEKAWPLVSVVLIAVVVAGFYAYRFRKSSKASANPPHPIITLSSSPLNTIVDSWTRSHSFNKLMYDLFKNKLQDLDFTFDNVMSLFPDNVNVRMHPAVNLFAMKRVMDGRAVLEIRGTYHDDPYNVSFVVVITKESFISLNPHHPKIAVTNTFMGTLPNHQVVAGEFIEDATHQFERLLKFVVDNGMRLSTESIDNFR